MTDMKIYPLLLASTILPSLFLMANGHVYTDSFPLDDEYDFAILDPDHAFGSPFGGFSRATASRLASLPLKLPNVAEELTDFEPVYMHIRDSQGRPFVCRAYHEDELDPKSFTDSMFDMAKVVSNSEEHHAKLKTIDEIDKEHGTYMSVGGDYAKTKASESASDMSKHRATLSHQDHHPPEGKKDFAEQVRNLNHDLAQLRGFCAQFHRGWWSYEWCYQDKVTQFHVHMDKLVKSLNDIVLEDVTSLGTYHDRSIKVLSIKHNRKRGDDEKDAGIEESAEVTDTYLNGDICPGTGRPRVTESVMQCCTPERMHPIKGGIIYNGKPIASDLLALESVQESDENVCEYFVRICTPLLCAGHIDEKHETPKEQSTHTGKKPILPDTRGKVPGYDASKVEQMSIQEILDMTFGGQQQGCIQSGTGGWWVYELCPGEYVRQFHEVTLMDRLSGVANTEVESEHILGKYDPKTNDIPKHMEWKNVVNATELGIGSKNNKPISQAPWESAAHGGNGAYFFQEFTSGNVCDHEDVTDSAIKAGQIGEGGIERATTVRYSCGNQVEMNVKEDSTCHYLVDVSIPALCAHPLFKAPVSKKQVVKCLPAF